MRNNIIAGLFIINILFFILKDIYNKKIFSYIISVFIIICLILSYTINYYYSIINSINKNRIIYSSSLITLKNSNINTISDINNNKIGIIDDNTSIDNYIIAKEIIDENNLSDNNFIIYDDLMVMLKDLYDKKIDVMFISSSYSDMFKNTDGFENINDDVKVIIEKDKEIEKEVNTVSYFDNYNIKPFTILLMGIDSSKEGIQKNNYANGDALMLLTVNPNTLNITMLSIPRDSYVPISCRDNKKNKLTHIGWLGTDCMINTIENVFDVDINYYIKINFKGVVHLIDKLNGITVDVPKKLCTDDSNRKGKICINKGIKTLNGEETLVLARNRHNLSNGDIDRGYNQQLIVRSIFDKLIEINSVTTLLDLINSISNNIDTNFTTEEILSFYNIFNRIKKEKLNIKEAININQLIINGKGKTIYFDNYKKNLWCFIIDDNSINEVSTKMKDNLLN